MKRFVIAWSEAGGGWGYVLDGSEPERFEREEATHRLRQLRDCQRGRVYWLASLKESAADGQTSTAHEVSKS